jgi:hypothetical protein
MKLKVHRLHDDAHAALAEHSVDTVPARQDSSDLHAAILHHWRCAFLQVMSFEIRDSTTSRTSPLLINVTTAPSITLTMECTAATQASKSTTELFVIRAENAHVV